MMSTSFPTNTWTGQTTPWNGFNPIHQWNSGPQWFNSFPGYPSGTFNGFVNTGGTPTFGATPYWTGSQPYGGGYNGFTNWNTPWNSIPFNGFAGHGFQPFNQFNTGTPSWFGMNTPSSTFSSSPFNSWNQGYNGYNSFNGFIPNNYGFNGGFNTGFNGYNPGSNGYSWGSFPQNTISNHTPWAWSNTPYSSQTFEPTTGVNPFGHQPTSHNVNGVPAGCGSREAA